MPIPGAHPDTRANRSENRDAVDQTLRELDSVLAEYAGARTWQPLFYFDFYDQHGQQIFLGDRF